MNDTTKKVGLFGLVAIVVGSMIGGGVFNIPSLMAKGSALGPVILAWIVTGIGMYFLANSFRILSTKKPDLSAGIYSYAKEGLGRFMGFNSAWGYWLSAAIGNVSFAVLVMEALGAFFPVFTGHNWQSILGASVMVWSMPLIVSRGVKGATVLNIVSTIAKLAPLFLFIIILIFAANWDKMSWDFWGTQENLGSIPKQIKSTMLVTLWSFIGIEGAVVISGRAKNKRNVGKATVIGFIVALTIYALISIFSYGIMHHEQLKEIPNPSVAGVFYAIVGNWGKYLIDIGVIISILGAWLAWTIMTAEVPFAAATDGILPKFFKAENKKQAPIGSLISTAIIMQMTVFIVLIAKNAYDAIISIAGVMVLPVYVFSSFYLWKLSVTHKELFNTREKVFALMSGIIATFYGLWLIYAGGLIYIMLSSIMYALGIGFYIFAVRNSDKGKGIKVFRTYELIIALVLVALAIYSVVLLVQGKAGF